MKKKILPILAVFLIVILSLVALIQLVRNNAPKEFTKRDLERLAEVQKLRDKSNWKKYTNSELGFSLLIPATSEPRSLSETNKTGGRFQYQTDIEFDLQRMVYIPTYSPEDIEVGIVDSFQRNKYVPDVKDRTYIIPQEYIHDFPLYAEQKGITLEKLQGTDLVKIGDYQYHHYGDKNLSFTFTGGEHIRWMLNDDYFIFGYPSKAAQEVKEMQLEILQTVEFFPPSAKM